MESIGLLFVVIAVIVLFAVSPLGIWNRLIKMHNDAKRDAAALLAAQEKTNKLLALIANELSKRSV